LWCHADVEAGASANIRSEAQEAHLRRFAEHLKDIHAALEALRHTHHAHLRAALNHEESLLWRTHAKVDGNDLSAETRQRMTEAEAFMAKLAATLQPPDSLKSAGVWWSVAQGIVRRADMALGEHYGRLLTPLVAALARQGSSPPDWVDPAILASLLDDEQGPLRCWLVRDAATGCLLLQAEPAGARQSPLGEPLVLDAGGARLRVGEGVGAFRRWLSTRDLPMALAPLSEPMPLHLVTAREAITIAAVKRPPGVLGWSCDRAGISVNGAQLGDHEAHWAGENLRTVGLGDESEDRSWALEAAENWDTSLGGNASARFGLDGKHGLYADVRFVAPHGSVAQRFRWIEPGTFWMGSPDDEHERSDNEGPRHAVTLTRGFWLADTACTQALWQAVMGSNSSQFTGDPQRPVEWVSWHDVQGFLRKLEALVPGCRADLPTEAEWEYACRAGTDTPFSFGVQITPEQVNYNGNYPYAGGEKGVYREQTVPVKSLPPNAWGLYEMHGNVWEWCADGLRTYDGKPQQDPIGPILEGEEAPPAFRGGSWLDDAWWARSACRRAHLPGLASLAQGFRLCLRSIEIGRVPGRPGGTAGLASGGSQSLSTPPREEARLLERLKRAFRSGGKKKR
jgi:formylglycine-generating enzyme required for sulfatase activity